MPQQKDLKRLIRARMKKTGESYTAARAVIVGRPATRLPAAGPKSKWADIAGMRDAAVKDKTGRDWKSWVAELDAAGAYDMTHTDIARHVRTSYDISGWWAQTVTVGYERIRGLRDVGQKRDGSFEANKSRTFPVDMSTLYAMFKDSRRRKRWLPDGIARVRTSIDDKSIRADWHDGTRVHLYFTSKGPTKSTVAVQHVKLSSKAAVTAAKAAWTERLDALRDALR